MLCNTLCFTTTALCDVISPCRVAPSFHELSWVDGSCWLFTAVCSMCTIIGVVNVAACIFRCLTVLGVVFARIFPWRSNIHRLDIGQIRQYCRHDRGTVDAGVGKAG